MPGLSWQGSQFHLALLPPGVNPPPANTLTSDPPGSITPANYTLYPGVEYHTGPTYAWYRIPNPAPGIWRLLPVGANSAPLPAVPEPVISSLYAVTDVVMDVAFAKSTYAIGEAVGFQVSLAEGGSVTGEHTIGGGSINNAAVTATVSLPASPVQQHITLTPLGNGLYAGSFTNTQQAGTYRFDVDAQGTTPIGGVTFVRQNTQSVFVTPPPSAVLFAINSMTLLDSVQCASGSIIVNSQGSGTLLAPGYDLLVGKGVTDPAQYSLKASRIRILAGAKIGGDVIYKTTLTNDGTIAGQTKATLTVPVVSPLPPFESAVVGTQNVTVGKGKQLSLAPGRYRDLDVGDGGTLTLSAGGVYEFRTVHVGTGSSLLAVGAVHIRIAIWFATESRATIGAAPGSGLTASDIVFYSGATDQQCPLLNAVFIGVDGVIKANIYSPNGTLLVCDRSQLTGSFIAKYAGIGRRVRLSLATSFPQLAKQNDASEAETVAGDIPEKFALDENYPNPFNPSTVINYQLTEPGEVSLSVYNMLGQEVRTLVSGPQSAGRAPVRWGMGTATRV